MTRDRHAHPDYCAEVADLGGDDLEATVRPLAEGERVLCHLPPDHAGHDHAAWARSVEGRMIRLTWPGATVPLAPGGVWHDEWRVTGDPTVVAEGVERPFPAYVFTYDSRDERWPDAQAEAEARAFIARQAGNDRLAWRDGPHLHHRHVFIGDWTHFAAPPSIG